MNKEEELKEILKNRTEELNSTNKAFKEYVQSKSEELKKLKEENERLKNRIEGLERFNSALKNGWDN